MKQTKAILNPAKGYDLLTERDAGNPVRILTGKPLYSVGFWIRLKELSEAVLEELKQNDEDKDEEIIARLK